MSNIKVKISYKENILLDEVVNGKLLIEVNPVTTPLPSDEELPNGNVILIKKEDG